MGDVAVAAQPVVRPRYEVRVETAAPTVRVWALLADAGTWSEWGPWHQVTWLAQGDPEPQGVGAVRRLVFGRRVVLERITAFEVGRHVEYTVVRGFPVRDYRGVVTLTGTVGGGCEIHWRGWFGGRVPGIAPIIAWRLRPIVADIVARLAAAAAQPRS